MHDPSTDIGISTERPTYKRPGPEIKHGISGAGDSFPGENHGRSIEWDDGATHHLDLTSHSPVLAGINRGTIAFWLGMDGWMMVEISLILLCFQHQTRTVTNPFSVSWLGYWCHANALCERRCRSG